MHPLAALALLALLACLLPIPEARADVFRFTGGGDGGRLADPDNWERGELPPELDSKIEIEAETSPQKPVVVDSGWERRVGNFYLSHKDGAHLAVESGGVLATKSLYVGGQKEGLSGELVVREGGTLSSVFANSGMTIIGGVERFGAKYAEGVLKLHDGATAAPLNSLFVSPKGILELISGKSGFCRVSLKGDGFWEFEGRLKIDLARLAAPGRFELLAHEPDGSEGATMKGLLRGWLDEGGGAQSGKGDGEFGSGVLEVVGSKGRAWTLEYREPDGAGILSLSVE